MYNVFIEATDNIRVMHEIETILDNDDIPARSRSHFLSLLTISCTKKLTKKQQKNVQIFRELFVRIDKDTRMFRTFLNLAVDLAVHYKFENSPLVYAFKNLSIEDHFLNFVDFAKRRNPVIDKNNPLQLFLSLGISIIKLSIKKNQMDTRKKDAETNKKLLLNQYSELSREMSERFINMDFGDDLMANKDEYTDILDDSDDYDSIPPKTVAQIHNINYEKDYDPNTFLDTKIQHNFSETKQENFYKSPMSKYDYRNEIIYDDEEEEEKNNEDKKDVENNSIKNVDESVDENELNKICEELDKMSTGSDIAEIMENVLDDDDQDSGITKDTENEEILKSLKNGDKELNLQHLDSLVMEAGRHFGPSVLGAINRPVEIENSPVIRFNNHSVKNIVDFIHPNN